MGFLLLPPLTLLLLFSAPTLSNSGGGSSSSFVPRDNFLVDCGGATPVKLPDGRLYKSDQDVSSYLSSKDNIPISAIDAPPSLSPILATARVFVQEATFTFPISRPGWHWLRLRFLPFNNSLFDLSRAHFSVSTPNLLLLRDFTVGNTTTETLKEYIVNVTDKDLVLKFSPFKNSHAFLNAMELTSAPDALISDTGSSLFPVRGFSGLSTHAYQTLHRVNAGGPAIAPGNDTLGRRWVSDKAFLKTKASASDVVIAPGAVTYGNGVSPLIAPQWVYASAVEMANSNVADPSFNITWNLEVDQGFAYLLRFHFCDIVSKALNDLYFNVYVNEKTVVSDLDLSTLTSGLAVPYYKDVVVSSSMAEAGMITAQVGRTSQQTGIPNAILNGLEVFKMSNAANSLDGEFGVEGSRAEGKHRAAIAAAGFLMMFGAFVGLGAMVVKWKRRPQDWQKRNSFSSWLLPLHAADASFMTSGSKRSNFVSSTGGFGRYFSFAELQEATRNFDARAIIGVGGFGKVYVGEMEDGTKVAVKRANPDSDQGVAEFQTEIQMLSKLRHKHLLSLVGYCDEEGEMILVYEYMSGGTLRDHLYGKKNLPPLPWRKRLDICIGSARGLHYLHTGAAHGIIHRDVKTTNILLDEQLVAKVADFGLSKAGPTMEQTHVSTAVKGSFGYLDPEYFRRQQLTDKSDVYSFGVVLLEVLCARPALNQGLPREEVSLAEWGMQCKRRGVMEKIIDPYLVGGINPESLKKFGEAAAKCLAEYGADRPTMGDVLWNLEYALQLQEAAVSQGRSEDVTVFSPGIVGGGGGGAAQQQQQQHSGTEMFARFSNLNGR